MPKLCCAVDCRNIAAATIAVNTSVNVEDSGPPTAPFDSAWKTGQETILWLCYMIIYCRYCCVGRVHHLVSLFCDRWQKNGDARFRFFGALHGLYSTHWNDDGNHKIIILIMRYGISQVGIPWIINTHRDQRRPTPNNATLSSRWGRNDDHCRVHSRCPTGQHNTAIMLCSRVKQWETKPITNANAETKASNCQ